MDVRLGVGLRVLLLLALDLPPDDVLANIVLLGEVEELADLGRTLGAKALGEDVVGQAGDVVLALLDDHQGEDSDVRADDAATDGLALALARAAGPVAGVAVRKEETDTVRKEDTLLHGETLLVVASGDAENVSFEFITEGVAGNLLRHLLVVEDTESTLIVDINSFLLALKSSNV